MPTWLYASQMGNPFLPGIDERSGTSDERSAGIGDLGSELVGGDDKPTGAYKEPCLNQLAKAGTDPLTGRAPGRAGRYTEICLQSCIRWHEACYPFAQDRPLSGCAVRLCWKGSRR